MAWWETDRVTERKRLIMEWLSGDFTVTELSHRHDISRDKAHKWIRRYRSLSTVVRHSGESIGEQSPVW